jgi:hypothetical protein
MNTLERGHVRVFQVAPCSGESERVRIPRHGVFVSLQLCVKLRASFPRRSAFVNYYSRVYVPVLREHLLPPGLLSRVRRSWPTTHAVFVLRSPDFRSAIAAVQRINEAVGKGSPNRAKLFLNGKKVL